MLVVMDSRLKDMKKWKFSVHEHETIEMQAYLIEMISPSPKLLPQSWAMYMAPTGR